MRFKDRVAFITGGAMGFGRAFGRALAAEGASVVIADIDPDAGAVEAEHLASEGHRALAVRCDVAAEEDVEAAVAAATEAFGGIDILINNAGRHLLKYNQPFSALPRDEVRTLFDVNVMGPINCTLACRPAMQARGGGVIVNVSSISGHLVTSPYGVSKLAVRGLTTAFASELAPDGIRVNAVSPGLTLTEAGLADFPESMIEDFVHNRQLVHRAGTMADTVSLVLFLCSDDASFITGETVKVSGGYPLGV